MNIKTLVYKNCFESYNLIKIKNGESKKIKLVLEEPLNGKIALGELVFNLSGGVAEIDATKLPEGKNFPILYSGGKIKRLEGFIYSSGEISFLLPDPEYVRNLSASLAILSERLDAALLKIEKLEKQITETINF